MNKENVIRELTFSMALLFCAYASAAKFDDRRYIDPGLSYIKADSDRNSKNGPGIRLGAGKVIGESRDLEANVVADKLNGKNDSDNYKQKGHGLDGLHFFQSRRKFFALCRVRSRYVEHQEGG